MLVKQQTEEYVDLLEQAGMTVCYPDLEPFKKKTVGVMEVFSGIYGYDLTKQLKEYRDKKQ